MSIGLFNTDLIDATQKLAAAKTTFDTAHTAYHSSFDEFVSRCYNTYAAYQNCHKLHVMPEENWSRLHRPRLQEQCNAWKYKDYSEPSGYYDFHGECASGCKEWLNTHQQPLLNAVGAKNAAESNLKELIQSQNNIVSVSTQVIGVGCATYCATKACAAFKKKEFKKGCGWGLGALFSTATTWAANALSSANGLLTSTSSEHQDRGKKTLNGVATATGVFGALMCGTEAVKALGQKKYMKAAVLSAGALASGALAYAGASMPDVSSS
jgi:hypothetical protein